MNRNQFVRIAGIIAVIALPLLGHCPDIEAGPPEFSAALSSSKIRMGETATLQIKAQWPKGPDSFTFMMPVLNLENLSIIRSGESQETALKNGREWSIKTFEIELSPTKPGKGLIRAFSLNYLIRSEISDSSTPPSDFYRFPDHTLEIAPAPSSSAWILFLIGSGLLIISGALWGLRIRKKMKAPPSPLQVREDPILHKIQSLITSCDESALKDTVFEVAGYFRDFLIGHFQLKCKTYSEIEILEALKMQEAGDADLFRLLTQIHNIKYAAGRVDRLTLRQLGEGMAAYIQGKKILGPLSPSS